MILKKLKWLFLALLSLVLLVGGCELSGGGSAEMAETQSSEIPGDSRVSITPCGIVLTGLSETSGYAGQEIELYGTWGLTQGTKMPCINKDGLNKLIVVNWTNTVVTVQIPSDLPPGMYRILVYCQSTFRTTNSSTDWMYFQILKPIPVPCGIKLTGLSHTSGYPGQVFKMYGTWGPTQGVKIPCINKGGMNELIVLNWTDTELTVKIPYDLTAGDYRVGVYCNPLSWGLSYSSGWMDFEILAGLM